MKTATDKQNPQNLIIMAVWIYAYGKNGLSINDGNRQILDTLNAIDLDELKILETVKPVAKARQYYTDDRINLEKGFKAMNEDEYRNYLTSIRLPYIKVEDIIDHFIADGERREHEDTARYNFIYNEIKKGKLKSQWEVCGNNAFVNKLCYFNDNFDGLTLTFINDLIRIKGPFSVFSKYFSFLHDLPKEHRAYYHSYFKKILKAFKSDFILYAHEWSGLDDEDNDAFTFQELKDSSNWAISSSKTLDEMDKFYYELLV